MPDLFSPPVIGIDLGASFTKVSFRKGWATGNRYEETARLLVVDRSVLIPSLAIFVASRTLRAHVEGATRTACDAAGRDTIAEGAAAILHFFATEQSNRLTMESFEHVTKIWLEAEGYAVSSGVKFPVKILTRKKSRPEEQTHGYEIDLVGARANELVLVNVKSFFGSKGLDLAFLRKEKIFSNPNIFKGIVDGAGSRFGYSRRQIRLYVVAGRATDGRRREIESWLADFSKTNRLPVTFIGVERIAEGLLKASTSKMYIDDPVIATVKTLRAAGCLKEEASSNATSEKHGANRGHGGKAERVSPIK